MARTHPGLGTVAVVALVFTLQLACGQTRDPAASANRPTPEALWLQANAVSLSTVDPAASLDDLEPLRQMVGDARVVALGEATHGTREFFLMKHRILRFLVERMGFSAFAIEATWPESNRVDRFVRTGEGIPEVLLSGLYFWTWNTSEVLDQIRWMRSYSSTGGSLGFYGFDMQAPGMAIDNVSRFVRQADDRSSVDFTQHMSCLAAYANDAGGHVPTPGYANQPQAYRDACLQDLHWVEDTLTERQGAYSARTSESDWALAARSAHVAIQYEQMSSNRVPRDFSMADNVSWLLDRLGPQARIVLWAHNYHVSAASGAMGAVLRQRLGAQLFVVGFAFGTGTFNAHRASGSAIGSLGPLSADRPIAGSYEEKFSSAGMPEFLLDLRGRDPRAADSSWLAGPRPFRSIGALYDPTAPANYWQQSQLPQLFDAVIFLETTTPSTLLPFQYPSAF